jgi:hypothetical protein
MGMGKTKERRAWVYLNPDDEKIVDKLTADCGGKITEAAILSVLMSSALQACAAGNYRFTAKLRVIDEPPSVRSGSFELNEPKPRK